MNGKKHIFKHVLAFVMILCTLFALITINASAETSYLYAPAEKLYSSPGYDISSLENITDIDEFKSYLREKLIQCPDKINISDFEIPAHQKYLDCINNMIWYEMVDMFHVNGVVGSVMSGMIFQLNVSYNMTPSEFDVMYSACLSRASKILSGIQGNSSLSDVQKALLIHDRLAVFCEYDYANYLNGVVPHDSYTMYGALGKGVAVCQGYSEAYLYLLERVGVDSYICSSDALDHAWNIVTINGKNYHVDVTWDDPTWDKTGYVLHENFLVSNSGIYSSNHTANDYDQSATDKKYDNYFWRQSHTSFELIGNEIYYIDSVNKTLNRYSDRSSVYAIDETWFNTDHSYYEGSYSCLSSNGEDLFFSTTDSIYEFDVNTATAEKVCSPEIPSEGYYHIYGFTYDNGYFVCDIYNSPVFDANTKKNHHHRYFYEKQTDESITGIEIADLPEKSVYYIGDEFSADGLVLKVNIQDGTSKKVSDGFEIVGFDSLTEGKKTLTVSYAGHTASFEIEVRTPCIVLDSDSISLEKLHHQVIGYCTEPAGCEPIWASSDSHIVRVDSDGKITSSYKTGDVTITATFVYNGITYSDTCAVSVGCAHFGIHHTEDAVASTCTTPGHEAYVVCTVCGEVIEGSDAPLPLAEHKYVEVVADKYIRTQATCTQVATYTESCSVCGHAGEKVFSGDEIDADNHVNTEIIPPVEPCVNKDGLTRGEKCTDCGVTVIEQQVIPAGTEHKYSTEVVESTCTEEGYTVYTCLLCNHEEIADYTPAKGHSFGDWMIVKEPDENEEGLEERICSECDELEERVIEKLAPAYITGDVNNDGKITAADARLALRLSAGLETLEKLDVTIAVVDYNGDNKITAADARKILRRAAGLE